MLLEVDKMLLTSGTLEPAGDFALLKSGSELDKTWKFSCGHVVGKDNFKAICVGNGFDFRYQQRNDKNQLQKVVDFINHIASLQSKTIAGGLIVFVQSYGYQKSLKQFIE